MNICPQYKSPEWKELVKLVGSDKEAEHLYMAYNDIPTKEMLEKDGFLTKKKKGKFQALSNDLSQRIDRLNNSIKSKMLSRKKASIEDKKALNIDIQRLKKDVEILEQKVLDVNKANMLEQIEPFAIADLAEVDRILDSKQVTANDLINVKNTLLLWINAGDFKDGNIFFNEDEYSQVGKDNPIYNDIVAKFSMWSIKAGTLHGKYIQLMSDITEGTLSGLFEKDVKLPDTMKDVDGLTERVLSIDVIDNILMKGASKMGTIADFESKKEASSIVEELGRLFEDLGKKYKIEDIEELFKQHQSNSDSRETGDMVDRFSGTFSTWNKDRRRKLINTLKTIKADDKMSNQGKSTAISKAYTKFDEEYKENMIMLDARKLFPDKNLSNDSFTEKEIEEHKQLLLTTLGQKGYAMYSEMLKKRVDEYKEALVGEEIALQIRFGENEALVQSELDKWRLANSPYIAAEAFYNDKKLKDSNGYYIKFTRAYTLDIPKRSINGKDTGFYDKKFEKIEANDDYLNLYEYLTGTIEHLNAFLPADIQGNLQMNSLPFMMKTLIESYTSKGLTNKLTPFWDYVKDNLREGAPGTLESSDSLNVLGEKQRNIQVNYVANIDKIVNDYIDLQSIKYSQENGSKPSYETKREWKKDITHQIAQSRSFNLEKLVKAYTLSTLAYKHKAKIQDSVELIGNILNNAVKSKENIAGEDKVDSYGDKIPDEGLTNLKRMFEHWLTHFYGERQTAQELVTGKKLYTKEELATKKELEDALAKNEEEKSSLTKKEYLKRRRILTTQLNQLGGYVTGGKIGDALNQYVRIKGLGWNVFSPIMNMQVGFINNLIEGSGGTYFNNEDLLAGYKLAWSKKASKMMSRLDVLKTIQNEIQETERLKKRFSWLAPMAMQEKSEYMNQTPIMIAMAKKFKVKLNDGTEISYWKCFDDNGELRKDVDADAFERKFKPKLDKVVAKIHGNYNSNMPIEANKNILGRSLLVFRKWMLNAFYDRLGKSQYDDILENEVKGRWRSYGSYFGKTGVKSIFDISLNLLRKLTFQKTNFNMLNETDAANMRKNLTEILALISVSALALMLKSQLDDDDSEAKYLCFFWVNQLNRVSMDITFYTNPEQFKTIIKDPLPVFSIITDASKAVNRSFLLLGEASGTDYENTYKAWRKMIPGIGNISRWQSATSQIINK